MKGRTIRLYLVDGTPTGILTAEIINWTGKLFVAPRSQLADLAKRDEVRRTGVYLLVGPDPDRPSRDRVYIGEGDSVLKRLIDHDKDASKEFWTRTVVVISKDENLTKSHGRYLESRLIEKATAAGRAHLANGTQPPTPSLPEPDVADMEFFLDQVQMILPVLGFGVLQPKPSEEPGTEAEASPRFVLSTIGAKATAIEAGAEFVVLQGSTARREGTASWDSYRALRDQLVADGKLAPSDAPDFYVFTEDVAFSSPSAAGTVVAARNTNGRESWVIEGTRTSYAQWQAQKIDRAAQSVAPINEE
ncbi:GIY-YIG nuclease family protein [Geoalkalibacter halelectricus]|uniref:GIY-YIG nuclease family protein n=1 Tax=Geoalkalibacter halelectricus TaxID=2847045 RepID=A0ABY5ZJ02_9BACT|nr:GIY-YIG nuclease family protein [Geoalkalibacter halelectricus]MDO3378116.1 GIY-YIG nuclease family protein [Geoalkalibacter halelectricus]UWZ77962.1 GIY-YIG nuclease family protein [Geoalkalibacter halelectricus]